MVKNGITLLSARAPESRCRKVADAVELRDKTLYFCPSPLYGYGLDLFLSRLEKEAPGSRVLCIEADPELSEQLTMSSEQLAMSSEKLAESREHRTERICFTNVTNPEKLITLVREKWGHRAFRRIEILKLTGGWQLYPDLYNSLYETLAREIANNWSNALTLTKLGRLYIRNMLKNLELVPRSKSIDELSFGASDVLVLGAGPSLDEALDALPPKRDFKIVCVDTCLGALCDRGIAPDLAVILESQHWNLRDFTGCRGWNVPFAFDMSALPASAFVLAGQRYLYFTPWTELAVFKRMREANLLPGEIPPLGSVGLTAMEIARRLTTGRVTHAGFDFCFTIDKTHARGTPSHIKKLNAHNRLGELIGAEAFGAGVIREGDKFYTPNMRNYRELFEREFGKKNLTQRTQRTQRNTEKDIDIFIDSEIKRLIELRDILTGKKICCLPPAPFSLIKECDYLWSHFPDYAGGAEPNCEDLSFLNRVRIEIDQMLKILERTATPATCSLLSAT